MKERSMFDEQSGEASIVALKRTRVPDAQAATVYGVFAHMHPPGSMQPSLLMIDGTSAPYTLGQTFALNFLGSGGLNHLGLPTFDMPEALRTLQMRREGDYLHYEAFTGLERDLFIAGASGTIDAYPTLRPMDLTVAYLRKELGEHGWEQEKARWREDARRLGATISEQPRRANSLLERIISRREQ